VALDFGDRSRASVMGDSGIKSRAFAHAPPMHR